MITVFNINFLMGNSASITLIDTFVCPQMFLRIWQTLLTIHLEIIEKLEQKSPGWFKIFFIYEQFACPKTSIRGTNYFPTSTVAASFIRSYTANKMDHGEGVLSSGNHLLQSVLKRSDDLEQLAPIDKLLTATLTAPTAQSCLVSGLSPCLSWLLHFSSIWTPTKYAIWTLISTVREDCMQEFLVFILFFVFQSLDKWKR